MKLFFEQIGCPEIDEITKYFVIKSFKGVIKNGPFKKNTNIEIFITVDYFVSIYELENNRPVKLLLSVPIEETRMNLNKTKSSI